MRKKYLSVKKGFVGGMILGLFFLAGCKDDTVSSGGFDPNSPVKITSFEPLSGSARTRMYIYGENFGNDVSQISVKIGGKQAKVVGSNGKIIYCIVPFRATEGTIEVSVGPDSVSAMAEEHFEYLKKTMVATLCGYIDETGKTEVKDGPFEDCGFKAPRWLRVDPKNKNHIYMLDDYDAIRMLDVGTDSVSTIIQKGQGNWNMLRGIEFTVSQDTMLVANEQDAENATAVSVLARTNNFKRPQHVTFTRKNNSCAVHPMNGELYYNSRLTGELFRYDWNTRQSKMLYVLKNRDCQYFLFFHPTGNYAYMTVPNKKLIMKAEYDWEKKELKPANQFAGQEGVQGCVDGQGINAKLGNPYQGCFVFNQKYKDEGREDCYDFYFCDQNAHAIRYLTPDGFVRTYAGRGSKGVDSDPQGYVDGDLLQEARFNQPCGITYDEENKIFYIADALNARIRTIVIDE